MSPLAWQPLPELELLLCCARPTPTEEVKGRMRSLVQGGVDWDEATRWANNNRLLPSLVLGLKATCPELIPPAVMDRLEAQFDETMRRTLFLTAELIGLLRTLDQDDIPVIPYKGPLLALALYGQPARRQFVDLDLLVPKEAVGRAQQVLASLGYTRVWPRVALTHAQERAHLAAKYDYQYVRCDGKVTVELHWGVSPRYIGFPSEDRWLWGRLERAVLGGVPVRTFAPEDYLVILCVHGGNHCWLSLGGIRDIAALIEQNPNLDWSHVIEQAHSTGVARMLFIGLILAHDLFETELPQSIWRAASRDSTATSLACEVSRQFSASRREMAAAFEVPLFHLRARERLRDKIGYCIAMLAPSDRDWSSWPLPESLAPLYYVLRPLRLFFEYGLLPLGRQIRSW